MIEYEKCNQCGGYGWGKCMCQLYLVRVPERDDEVTQRYGKDPGEVAEQECEEYDSEFCDYNMNTVTVEVRRPHDEKWTRFAVSSEAVINYDAREIE